MKKKINENMGGIMVTYVSPTKGKNQLLVKSVEEANMAIPEDATYFDITKGDNSSEEKNLVSWGGKGGYWDNASNPDFKFGERRKASEINNILNKKDKIKINESQLRNMIANTICEILKNK